MEHHRFGTRLYSRSIFDKNSVKSMRNELKLSTSIYDLVLIYVCHFHHHPLRVTQITQLLKYSCWYLGSPHPRILLNNFGNLLLHIFGKNFVKVTVLLKKLLISFDEKIFRRVKTSFFHIVFCQHFQNFREINFFTKTKSSYCKLVSRNIYQAMTVKVLTGC